MLKFQKYFNFLLDVGFLSSGKMNLGIQAEFLSFRL